MPDTGLGYLDRLRNDGSGNFTHSVAGYAEPRVKSVTAGEFDGDGDLDLAVTSWGFSGGDPNIVSILKQLPYGALFEDRILLC